MKKFKNDKKLALFVRYLYENNYYIEGFHHQSLFLKSIKKLKTRSHAYSCVFYIKKKYNGVSKSVGTIFVKSDIKNETNFLCNYGTILDQNDENIFDYIIEEVKFLDNIHYWGW